MPFSLKLPIHDVKWGLEYNEMFIKKADGLVFLKHIKYATGNFISSLILIINLVYDTCTSKSLRNTSLCQEDNNKNTVRLGQLLCMYHLTFILHKT